MITYFILVFCYMYIISSTAANSSTDIFFFILNSTHDRLLWLFSCNNCEVHKKYTLAENFLFSYWSQMSEFGWLTLEKAGLLEDALLPRGVHGRFQKAKLRIPRSQPGKLYSQFFIFFFLGSLSILLEDTIPPGRARKHTRLKVWFF